jgi:hypothetical protein
LEPSTMPTCSATSHAVRALSPVIMITLGGWGVGVEC